MSNAAPQAAVPQAAVPQVFDRAVYRDRQFNASQQAGLDDLTAHVAADLGERLPLITRKFDTAHVIATDPQPYVAVLQDWGHIGRITTSTISATDNLDLPEAGCNAIFSFIDLQCINDVPGYLVQLRRTLRPDGLLLAALFAGDTLKELREAWLVAEDAVSGGATPRVAPMIDARALGGLLQRAGFALPVVDTDRTILRYADPIALLREVRSAGFANCLSARARHFTSRQLFAAMLTYYQENFHDADLRIRATLELAWATAWSPHDSQPKPLAPGSAKHRLADALQVPETKLKED